MSGEILTTAELFRSIADAIDAGEQPGSFQRYSKIANDWVDADTWFGIIKNFSAGCSMRRKPRTRHLIDQNGKRWDWPAPIRTVPKYQSVYYAPVIDIKSVFYRTFHWGEFGEDFRRFKNGLCHTTEDAAIQHARALIAASGGKVSDE